MSDQPFDPPTGLPQPPLTPPTLPPPPPPPRRLVRDPNSKLGGVASGLSHHYGIDVSLIRIAFVVSTIFTGLGLPIYLLAWLIIPRADRWPPVGVPGPPGRAMSPREIAVGLLLVGGLVALFVDRSPAAGIVVPLALIAGGIWLLLQPEAADPATATGHTGAMTGPSAAPTPPGGPQPVDTPTEMWRSVPPGSAPVPPAAAVAPARPRRPRRRRRLPLILAGVALVLVALPVAAVSALLLADIDIGSDFEVTYRPEDVASIPQEIEHGAGTVVVDLTDLEPEMFDEGSVPMRIELGFGEVLVLVPEGLSVAVDATNGAGDVRVFESTDDGFGNDVAVPASDPEIDLDIEVGFGEIVVERVDQSGG